MIEDIFKKRFHVQDFNDKIPDKSLIQDMITRTYQCVPSKQLVVPYAVTILGPDKKDEKTRFYEFCRDETGLSNDQIKDNNAGAKLYNAPYVLIFTTRVIENLSKSMSIQYQKSEWCWPAIQTPHKLTSAHYIEIGMFSIILAGMCIENNLASSFSLLFPRDGYQGWEKMEFIKGRVLFCMTLGYTDMTSPISRVANGDECRPPIKDIINFL